MVDVGIQRCPSRGKNVEGCAQSDIQMTDERGSESVRIQLEIEQNSISFSRRGF